MSIRRRKNDIMFILIRLAILRSAGKKRKAVDELKEATPKDTGRASEGWYTVDTEKGFEVRNDVPYIDELNEGHSQQAPEGFIEDSLTSIGKVRPL